MDRRETLTTLIGKRVSTPVAAPIKPPEDTTLAPYAGAWGFEQAAHLLRRAMFSPTLTQIKTAINKGLDATLEELLQELPLPEPPVNHYYRRDRFVAVGETWVDAPYDREDESVTYRNDSLRAWQMGLIFTEGVSIREKMTLFWHNHFAVNDIEDARYLYRYITLLRSNFLGNFRELVKEVTIDPAMLRFLNGTDNVKEAPNENYARELLELFTIGKGPFAGPGDYTNYTEQDVAEMARALTGWYENASTSGDRDKKVEAYFGLDAHDTGVKQLSHRFDNAIITNMGDQEYAHLVDIIFQKREVARFICRKLYRWFVYYKIDENIETNIIEPMAQLLIDNDYSIRPVVETLLRSEHFFHILSIGPMIKNPIDFVISLIKISEPTFSENLEYRYLSWYDYFKGAALMQMEYFFPPEVAGWKPYYQSPAFYRIWINASTLGFSMEFVDQTFYYYDDQDERVIKFDVLKFIKQLDDPYDPNKVIEGFAQILFPRPITAKQITALKEIILPGLPDYEWGVEYTDYEANPNDMQLANAIDTKLRELLSQMMKMAEFYLS
ncbi:MAG: DUF1800 domain-containing protein [Saprospiraceae bacterium]|nr:DUF1800 domain-containing protein [Saprospiraceae bacterium]